MDIIQDFIPENRGNRPGHVMKPEFITIHDTANPNATALNHAAYLSRNSIAERLPVSWHFSVDDTNIVQHLPCSESGWHAGDGNNGPGNRRSIGIEICEFTDSGRRSRAEENAAWLAAYLADGFNIPVECIVQHHHWTGKNCPRVLRARTGGWAGFINMVKKNLQIYVDVPNDHWAAEEIRFCKANNLMVGTGKDKFEPDKPVTRAQLAVVVARLYNLLSELK